MIESEAKLITSNHPHPDLDLFWTSCAGLNPGVSLALDHWPVAT